MMLETRVRVVAAFLAVAVLLALGPGGIPALPAEAAPLSQGTEVSFSGKEMLGRPTDTSIIVTVVPDGAIELYYQYDTAPSPVTYSWQTGVTSAAAGEPCVVTLSGLSPDTEYFYRMVYRVSGSAWVTRAEHSFHTQRAEGTAFIFTVTSDSHVNIMLGSASTWQQTMSNVAEDQPDFHIDLGDTFAMDSVSTVAGAEVAYLYQRQFFDLVGHSAAIFVTPGNHEEEEGWHLDDTGNPATSQPVLSTNARKKYFPNPVPDGFYTGNTETYSYLAGDQLHEDYYAWEWGDALFVVFDPFWYTTTKPYTGNTGGGETSDTGSGDRWDWTLGRVQYDWLKQTLENSGAKYKFLFAHHMVGGSDDYVRGGAVPAHICEWGGYNENGTTWGWDTKRPSWPEPIHDILVDNHVSAFFHGHDHQYAHEARDGVVYQSLPAAGFSGSGFGIYNESNPYTEKVLPSPGHLRVSVTPDETTVAYVATTSGSVNYTYSIEPGSGTSHDLTMAVEPAGSGTTTPSVGVHSYAEGVVVNIAANAGDGYEFGFWTGDVADANAATTTVTMDSDQAVTAHFSVATGVLGGVNGDGAADSTDALIVLSCDAGVDTTAYCPMNCGDANGDGLINSTDALVILSYDVGVSVPYAIGEAGCPANVTPCAGCTP